MKRVLFLIHDLGEGGAEKVLVNLVNNLDTSKFDVTVMTLFDIGINKQFLKPEIKYKSCFSKMIRGNSHLMKLLSPKQLHKWLIKEKYDIEVAYLEGPCARVISGCDNKKTKLVSWIHIEQHTAKRAAGSFRTVQEAKKCYEKFDKIISVSKSVEKDFKKALQVEGDYEVLYNTNESDRILQLSKEPVLDVKFQEEEFKIVGVGKLLKSKGFDRIIKIVKKLKVEYPVHLYILGMGPEEENLKKLVGDNNLQNCVSFLGYQINPYKYVSKCDLFVCASYAEGFSTATTEALILGIPVCTVEVSGMKEMLGDNNEYGVVTSNDTLALYNGVKNLISDPQQMLHYKKKSTERGIEFSSKNTVIAVEDMLKSIDK